MSIGVFGPEIKRPQVPRGRYLRPSQTRLVDGVVPRLEFDCFGSAWFYASVRKRKGFRKQEKYHDRYRKCVAACSPRR
jgi:hypothetical protein